ncbi:hypothetical protein [Desulfofundulus thermosubterraneus]|uniref:Uncharacterized protein n=1 Tax=Desulfofundulus thermosubterraneus DSM 16057 TaxID=1121432 RepID=A0A1M6MJF2_9FIRM|nr:hypothetical protein [Desulfofundulus thermosubterraneus]SHJ83611.1 hypothetical protein SAMN02745219_03456 [Desulfofundulus thermosubterraneus DSM 16057]
MIYKFAYVMVIMVFISVLIFANSLIREIPDEWKLKAAVIIVSFLSWIFFIGWYVAKKNEKVIALLCCIYLAVAPLAYWYWSETAFERAISLTVEYENRLKEWQNYKDLVPDKQWEKWNNYLSNKLKIADCQAGIYLYQKREDIPWHLVIASLVGIILSTFIGIDMSKSSDKERSD